MTTEFIAGVGSPVTFYPMTRNPEVMPGNARTIIVAYRRKKGPGTPHFTTTLAYLNQMRLQADDCICEVENPVCEDGDGCSVSGWHEDGWSSEYGDLYTKANLNHEYAEAVARAYLPEFRPSTHVKGELPPSALGKVLANEFFLGDEGKS